MNKWSFEQFLLDDELVATRDPECPLCRVIFFEDYIGVTFVL